MPLPPSPNPSPDNKVKNEAYKVEKSSEVKEDQISEENEELKAAREKKLEIEMYNEQTHPNRKIGIFESTNCLSSLTFNNFSKIIKSGASQPYKFFMLYLLPKDMTYDGDYKNFEIYYAKRKKIAESKNKPFLFFNVIYDYLGSRYWKGAVLSGLRYASEILFPLFLKQFLYWIEDEEADQIVGYYWAGALVLTVFTKAYVGLWGYYYLECCTLIIKNVVRAKIINNVSSISPGAKQYVDVAKVTNYMMVDLGKVTMYTLFSPNLIFTPFILLGLFIIIILEVGWVGVLIIVLLAVALYVQAKINKVFKQTTIQRMGIADKRGKKIGEIMKGVKIIKLNAWEKIMNKMILAFRVKEGGLIKKTFVLQGLSSSISTVLPVLFGIVVFTVYDAVHEEKLSVPQIYSLITLFNAFLSPVRFFIMSLLNRADAKAAASRINSLFNVDPIEALQDDRNIAKGTVEIENGDFNWEDSKYYKIFEKKDLKKEDQSLKILEGINFKISPGEFVAIVGKVGSGKSSLLLASMNEMVKQSGSVKKNGKIGFIQQEAFLMNDTIKENILFGDKYDEEWFNKVLDICQLRPDLKDLKAGISTEIGERGINLSGGQKQRISIARAVYSKSDIYLIDDSLSALDAYVGKKIMDEVFNGELKGKTRIMATHYLNVLEDEDVINRVCLIKEGKIVQDGKYSEVRQTQDWRDFSNAKKEEEEKKKEEEEKEESFDEIRSENEAPNSEGGREPEKVQEDGMMTSRLGSQRFIEREPTENQNDGEKSQYDPEDDDINNAPETKEQPAESKEFAPISKKKADEKRMAEDDEKKRGKLTVKEKRETGLVGAAVYGYYMKAAGICISLLTLLMYVLATVASVATNFWVGAWTQDKYELENNTYIYVYVGLGALLLFFVILRAFFLGATSKSAALSVYETIIWNILRRPMRFFDTTPSGVILNRCINDVSILDFRIPWLLGFFLNIFVLFLVVLIFTAILTPIVIIAILIAVIFIAIKFKQFVKTTTELKRLSQLSAAPMISLASEFIQGVTTIRNYGKNEQMLRKYVERADRHHACDLHEQIVGMWMRSKMEWSMCFVTSIGIFSIAFNKQYRIMTFEDASANGLVISYLLSLGATVSGVLFTMSNLAKGAVSIERLKAYAIWEDHERDFDSPEPVKKEAWPESGAIEGKNVTVRYRRGLKKVLDGVDFSIASGEKVGIVGRTGSGKSTLLLSLMRILEMEQEGDENFSESTEEPGVKLVAGSGKPVGKITIDGQDIEQLGLHHLRQKIAIIPQEPFLLQGSLKFNVDPFDKFTEDQIITALQSVSVLDTIRDEDIIDQKVKELKAKQKKGKKPAGKKPQGKNKTGAKESPEEKKEEEDEIKDPELERLRSSGPTVQDKLKYEIFTGGSNLSLGQRQLICIARTILVPPKILLMDEATANIDQKTDSVIQSLIKEKLSGTTVVTIAHRLITICQYDKIIILDYGKKSQEGTILQLLGEPEEEGGDIDKSKWPGTGIFANLVNEGGEDFRKKMIYCARNRDANPAEIFG